MYMRRLDTPHLDQYGARDFEGILYIDAQQADGAGVMANPRGTGGPEGGDGDRSATDDLAARIARAQGERAVRKPPAVAENSAVAGMSRAYRLAAEFVAAIIVGAGLGYGIDFVAGTKPWAMVVLLLVGFAAGVLNVARAAKEMNDATAVPPGTPALPDDDDDK